MEFNYIDIILLVILAYGLIKGAINGFIVELASIAALFLGVWGAIEFSDFVGEKLAGYLSWDEKTISIISFILIFVAIVIAVNLMAKALTSFTSIVMLSWLNRILGAIFGMMKMAFIMSIVALILLQINSKFDMIEKEELSNSEVFNYVIVIAPNILPLFDNSKLDDIFDQTYDTVEEKLQL